MSSGKEIVRRYAKRYLIDAMGAMAQGLFASLLVGTIISTIGTQCGLPLLVEIGGYAKAMAGPAMAVAIGYALKASPLVLFSLAAVGHVANTLGGRGGPLAVLILAIIAHEVGMLVSKKTKIDILVTPVVTLLTGALLSYLIAPAIGQAAAWLGDLIRWGTTQQPLLMGILVSVLVGIALTLPISSAAICEALGLVGLAGGAAVAGCCAQMVGFCHYQFPRKPLGRTGGSGAGHFHAAGSQHCAQPAYLAGPHTGVCHYGTFGYLRVPFGNERGGDFQRYGHLRPGRTDRGLYRLGTGNRRRHPFGDHRYGLDRACADLLYSAGPALAAVRPAVPPFGMG